MGKAWQACKAIGQHIGRRGAFLLFLFVLDELFGFSLLTLVPVRGFNLLLPLQVWGWIWIGTGVIIATGIPTRWDRFQYMCAAGLKAAWGLMYVDLWINSVPRAWVSAVIWLLFAGIVTLVAGWAEFPPLPRDRRQ